MAAEPRFRVVVADDFADIRHLVKVTLERSGRFEIVAEAENGVEAVEQATAHQPDILVLDLSMPVLSGMEALPQIRAASPDTKVVVLSGFDRSRMESEALAGGAVGYIEKGLRPSQLVDELLAVAGLMELVQVAAETARARLEAQPGSAASARRFVDETLRRWHCDELFDEVALLTSELVTNAILHAHSDIDLSVSMTADVIRIDVVDHSASLPAPRTASDEDTSGRGLGLVEALATSWGVDERPGGKSVWFEL
ncbi:MAG: response regulator, partial [Acidimicrobiia bacterium]|nr:response regulator [Acidimicrobiia bacterium]